MSSQYSTRHNAHSHCMDCKTNSSVFEDKNFSLVRESVTEWKFKTVLASSWVFPIRWNCAFVRSLRLSLNSLCFSFHFSSSRKAIHSFVSIYSHFHSLTHATRSLYYIWFRRKGNYSSVDRFIFSHFFNYRSLSSCRLDDQCCWSLTTFSLFDSRSIKWL